MKILILDDSPLRQDIFRRRFEGDGHKVVAAFTAREAIDQLELNHFDLICLDHDLGGNPPEYCDPSSLNTGSEVSRWMVKNPGPYDVVVHTMNPIGAENIINNLKNIDGCSWLHIPFRQLVSGWGLGSAQ